MSLTVLFLFPYRISIFGFKEDHTVETDCGDEFGFRALGILPAFKHIDCIAKADQRPLKPHDIPKEIGITCDIQQGVLSNVLVDWRAANYDAFSNAINATYSYDSFRNYNNFKHATSFMKYDRNPEIDHEKIYQLFLDAASTTDEKKMNELYKELEETLMDAACWVPLYYAVQRLAWDPDLNATGFVVNYRINDWSWK